MKLWNSRLPPIFDFWRNLGWVVSMLCFDSQKWNAYYSNHHFFFRQGIEARPFTGFDKVSSMSTSAGAGGCTFHSFVETRGTMLPETLWQRARQGGSQAPWLWRSMGGHGGWGIHGPQTVKTLMRFWPAHYFSTLALFTAWQSWDNVTCSSHQMAVHTVVALRHPQNPFQLFVFVNK